MTLRGARTLRPRNWGRGAARGALIAEPAVICHVVKKLAEFCLLRVPSIHVLTPRVSIQPPPLCHVASCEEERELNRQGSQNLLHAGPDLWSDRAHEPHGATRHWKTSYG